jgi:hypothetical protein
MNRRVRLLPGLRPAELDRCFNTTLNSAFLCDCASFGGGSGLECCSDAIEILEQRTDQSLPGRKQSATNKRHGDLKPGIARLFYSGGVPTLMTQMPPVRQSRTLPAPLCRIRRCAGAPTLRPPLPTRIDDNPVKFALLEDEAHCR